MNFLGQEPEWQVFEGVHSGPLPELSLRGPALNYALRPESHSPQMLAEYKLEPYDTLAQDCILTPVSLDGELDIPFSNSTPVPWRTPYSRDFELSTISPHADAQDVAKGMRKEVGSSIPSQFILQQYVRFLTVAQRRRAQNRKAQKAFRERKDKAIQRLEGEVEKLNSINRSLSAANEARLREIQELKAELEEQSSLSPSPVRIPCFEDRDGMASKRGSISSNSTSTSAAITSIVAVETTDVCGPFIKWRGKVYVDAESAVKRQPKECG
jgi:hypothetical protein